MPHTHPYQADCYCYPCDRVFARPSQLQRHLRMTLIHNSGARIYRCPQCNKGFTQKSNISEHLRSVHGLIPEDNSGNRSRGGSATRRRNGNPLSLGQGKRLAGENARREQVESDGSRTVYLPAVPTMVVPVDKEAPSVGVFSLATLENMHTEKINGEFKIPDFKEGLGAVDSSTYNSISASSTEAGSPSPYNFITSGPSPFIPSSTIPPPINPIFNLSPEDAEINHTENQVKAFFADLEARLKVPGLLAAFPNPSSVNNAQTVVEPSLGEGSTSSWRLPPMSDFFNGSFLAAGPSNYQTRSVNNAVTEPSLGEGSTSSSRLPPMSDFFNGSFSAAGPSNYQTRQLSPVSSTLLSNWFQAIETQRQENDLKYYEQRYGANSLFEDAFPSEPLTVHNGTVRPQDIEQQKQQQQQQPQQLGHYSPLFSDDLNLGLADYSTDDWYSNYTPTP
ncbi:transcriptional regulator family: C2H2 zinc finger [Agaricus bisporus var. burnettii]|uniref:Transcriptional regulator family: C2H2 zinc finger n=1 Tax=Agaricus bisporus var. burnettii TaxID=192524 RepID=A0A8H7C559_AGABI|nr:transcriptional regulator family: C2H2 zinc finger [Agaricus bisporus var. burnettii]